MKTTLPMVMMMAGLSLPAFAKSGRTYYTPERLQAAADNLAAHSWARDTMEQILHGGPVNPHQSIVADAYIGAVPLAAMSHEQLFEMMPPVTIPRRVEAQDTTLCPVHGAGIRRYSSYRPWKMDYERHPWKVICPIGGETYPSNDFAAGDLTGGDMADDGSGAVIDGIRYQFIRYYAHQCYLHRVLPAIRSLSSAYLLTGEQQYGEACAVLLGALAANFPGPHYHQEHCHKGEYGRRSGMVTDYIWECITIVPIALAYDAIWPVYSDSPALLAFLQSRGLPGDSPDAARAFFEQRVLRQAMQALLDEAISGNPGHHQLAAVTLALVMDDVDAAHHPNSLDLAEFAYHAGYAPSAWVMSNFLTRDGGGYEGPGYDRIKFSYIEVARRLEDLRRRHPERLPLNRFPRILEEPKTRAMYDFFIDITSIGFFTPEIGDAGGARLKPGFIPARYVASYPAFYLDGFRIFRDPRYAAALLGLSGTMPAGDLFEPSLDDAIHEAARAPNARVRPRTRLLDGYGMAFLTAGSQGRHAAEAVINYTALKGHYQDDFLTLSLAAHEMALLPDLGYPFTWNHRWTWDANIYTHNTVAVDGTAPLTPPILPRGWVSLLTDQPGLTAAFVAHDCYNPQYNHAPFNPEKSRHAGNHPPVRRYERIVLMIDEGRGDDSDSYVLDLFVVEGGKQHDQSWHSVLRPPRLPELDWQSQAKGTAAGPDVAYAASYVNPRGETVTNGLCFVTGVQRAAASVPATFEWEFGLAEPAGLRLHLVPVDGPLELIYGSGRSPARPETWQLPMLFARRNGDAARDDLTSRFLTLLEPYRGSASSRITGVEVEGTGWPLTIRVRRHSQEDTITIQAPGNGDTLTRGQSRDLGLRLVTRDNGRVIRDLQAGNVGNHAPGIVRGKILALERDSHTITVDLPPEPLETAPPWVRIHSPGRSSMYQVLSKTPVGPQRTQLTLKETSLLSRVLPAAYADGFVKNNAPTPFATGSVDAQGRYVPGTCRFAGARLEAATNSSVSHRIAGINGRGWITASRGYDIFLEEPVRADALETAFGPPGERQLTIHDYGVGDALEWVLVQEHTEGTVTP